MLGPSSMRILKHAIAVMRPRGGVFDIDVDEEVCRSMVGFLEYLPAPTRLSFPLGLRLLEYGPFLFREGFRTFSSMDGETAARYLHHWERAGSAPSLLYQGVRALVFVCFYQHPKILEAMEVDWQGRADERVRFRARIMRDQILRQAAAPAHAEPTPFAALAVAPAAVAPAIVPAAVVPAVVPAAVAPVVVEATAEPLVKKRASRKKKVVEVRAVEPEVPGDATSEVAAESASAEDDTPAGGAS